MDRSKDFRQRAKRVWYVYVVTLDRTLTTLFLFSLLILFTHDFVFAGWPEITPWSGELWDLFYELCLAFAASYIFYLVVVHIKRQHDKETLRPFLYSRTLNVAGQASALISDLKKASGHDDFEGEFPSSGATTERMCEAIDPQSDAPLIISTTPLIHANWLQLMDNYNQRTMMFMNQIYSATPFLEPAHLQLLMDIESDNHLSWVKEYARMPLTNSDLSFHAGVLHTYFQKAQRLQEYAHRHLTLSGKWEPL